MGILVIILFLLCLYRLKLSNFHEDYISKSSSDSIKGFFTIIILYSHLRSYLPPPLDPELTWIDKSFVIAVIPSTIFLAFVFTIATNKVNNLLFTR